MLMTTRSMEVALRFIELPAALGFMQLAIADYLM